jgi:glutamate dehydrogenase (NAD(P)+)
VEQVIGRWRGLSTQPAGKDTMVDLRTAAMTLAIERLARVTLERGIWP